MKTLPIVAIASLGVALSGCATVVEGTSQSIAVTSPPTTGAYCTLTSTEGNWTVLTPGVATVEKSKEDIVAHCSKEGWQDASATIPSDFQGWTVGNLVLGGVIGFGVDALSGAMHKYPHAFEIPMQPVKGNAPQPNEPATGSLEAPTNAPTASIAPGESNSAMQRFDRWQDNPQGTTGTEPH
jgi:hypothetical protein